MFEKMSFIPGMAINAMKTRQSAALKVCASMRSNNVQ